ncbi:hypothetical protein [Pedobacter paludis]|uniref:hypothetical protein n=1 Tax=Pedobacter paludis TaxID=2203212 RepID=UPI001F0BCF1F|nr:hypothetical protein [Pedobacter paludis]
MVFSKSGLLLRVKGREKWGLPVITYLQTEEEITMIYIYDKSEEATISKKDIQAIIDSL